MDLEGFLKPLQDFRKPLEILVQDRFKLTFLEGSATP